MAGGALFQWRDVLFQCVGFLASFGTLGAIGFRYGVALGPGVSRAGAVGMVGAALGGVGLVVSLFARAASKHTTFAAAVSAGGGMLIAQTALLVVLLVAFVLAWRRVAAAWPVAAVCAFALPLRGIVGGVWAKMVNPLHVVGASLWIGSLFVIVVCGLGETSREDVPVAERETAVMRMVRRFAFLALPSAALLGVTGVITAWTHLKHLDALWTTPYGYALLAKLSVVAIVVGLGAWNWRRVGPSLGREGGARTIQRTATMELGFAAVVLFLTGILVSIHTPKPATEAHAPPSGSTSAHPSHSTHAE
jgi:putative copper export protein